MIPADGHRRGMIKEIKMEKQPEVGKSLLLDELMLEGQTDKLLSAVKNTISHYWKQDNIHDLIDLFGNSNDITLRNNLRDIYRDLMTMIASDNSGGFYASNLRLAILDKILQGWSGRSGSAHWSNPDKNLDSEESFLFFCNAFIEAISRKEEDIRKGIKDLLYEHLNKACSTLDLDRWIKSSIPEEILMIILHRRVNLFRGKPEKETAIFLEGFDFPHRSTEAMDFAKQYLRSIKELEDQTRIFFTCLRSLEAAKYFGKIDALSYELKNPMIALVTIVYPEPTDDTSKSTFIFNRFQTCRNTHSDPSKIYLCMKRTREGPIIFREILPS
jgi:hypothetical protein